MNRRRRVTYEGKHRQTDIHRHTQTYTDVHKHTQTYTDIHRRKQTYTDIHIHRSKGLEAEWGGQTVTQTDRL